MNEVRLASIRQKLSASFDVSFTTYELHGRTISMIFLSSLSAQSAVNALIQGFTQSPKEDPLTFFNGSVSALLDEQAAITQILSGQCVVLLDHDPAYYSVETRGYPTRSVHAPENEKSIRGSNDAFVENIIQNVGLIRRRIRDERLVVELDKEGKLTKTDLALVYMRGIVDQDVLDDFKHRLQANSQVEIYNDRNLVEALYGKTLNPYPHVRYTECPDLCALHLLQGSLVVLVDTIPSAILLPTTFFEQIQQAEEYTQTPLLAFCTRLSRYIGIFLSIYLMPLWIALRVSENPTMLNLPVQGVHPFEFGFQILFAELVVEWIRQSLIHAPNMLSGIMGFLVVFVLGDFGIEFGAYTKEILIMIAISNLGNFLTPGYEISLANKFSRICLNLMTLFFKIPGFCIGIIAHFLLLLSTDTIKYPYLYPLIPFSFKEMRRLLFGSLIHSTKKQNDQMKAK